MSAIYAILFNAAEGEGHHPCHRLKQGNLLPGGVSELV